MRLSDDILRQLRCPRCGAKLSLTSEHAVCTDAQCGSQFPIIDGVPVLIDEKRSIFSLDDFKVRRDTTFVLQRSGLDAVLTRLLDALPTIDLSFRSKRNYATLRDLLIAETTHPKVLVLGGSILGHDMEEFAKTPALELVASDVSFGPLTALVCDAHDIPFSDQTFDAVVAQAVLEHVADPYRCVDEIHRVLKKSGFVYAETPFMQQVHMGPYDFTRFTHSGHAASFGRSRKSPAVQPPGPEWRWPGHIGISSAASGRLAWREASPPHLLNSRRFISNTWITT